MQRLYRRTGLLRFFLPICLLLGLALCIFVSPGALPQAKAHGFSMGVGTTWHSGRPYYGWPYGRYHRGWGHWPHYRHHA